MEAVDVILRLIGFRRNGSVQTRADPGAGTVGRPPKAPDGGTVYPGFPVVRGPARPGTGTLRNQNVNRLVSWKVCVGPIRYPAGVPAACPAIGPWTVIGIR